MQVKEIINNIHPVSSASSAEIIKLVDFREHQAGEVFIEAGERDRFEYFLTEGICRSFILSPEGEEVTIAFFAPPSVLSPFVTRTVKGISNLNFQAMTNIQVGLIDATAFESLMVGNLEIREFGNMVLKMELQKKVDKELSMASLTAKERLLKFRKEYSLFENLVPHTAIASFLGITNISLSRLRKDLMR